MSIVTGTLIPQLQKRLPKIISPTAHGVIDYAHAAFFLGLGIFLRKSDKRAATAAFATGTFVLLQSLLTDYPLGATPVFSFAQHREMDAAFASSSWVIPRLFGFSGTPAARVYQANAVVEGAVVGLTDWINDRAARETQQMHTAVSSAVQSAVGSVAACTQQQAEKQ